MANLDLSKYGITDVKEVLHNPSYDVLFAEETKPGLEGFEKGQVTELGAVNVMTGVYTGRSPKDKFFVKNEASENSVWWTSDEYKNDNKPCTEEAWADLKAKAVKQLSGKRLFVVDTFCGANAATRMKVRFIMEVAWQAHFVTNSHRPVPRQSHFRRNGSLNHRSEVHDRMPGQVPDCYTVPRSMSRLHQAHFSRDLPEK